MLPLPIQPKDALEAIIAPALELCGWRMDSMEAEVMILAIFLQESSLAHREQIGGPARGLGQFEKSGIRGVLRHPATASESAEVCVERGVHPSVNDVYEALSHDDILAACFSRLLLWTDPRPLPALGDVDAAWEYYVRNWKPGQPRPDDWPENYRLSIEAMD